jgi:serine/threonine-protein kinase
VQGSAKSLLEVSSNPTIGTAQIDFSRTGTMAYRSGGTELVRTLNWLDGTQKSVALGFEPAVYLFPRLSPDRSRLAYTVGQGANTDLFIFELQRGIRTRLTSGGYNTFPVWSADSQFLVFRSKGGIHWTRADRAGKPQTLLPGKATLRPYSFIHDGTQLVFSEAAPGGAEIRTVSVENRSGQLHAGQPQPFLKTATASPYPAFSPDGKWLAYDDAEGGGYEVYVRAFPDNGTKKQVSNAGGVMPMWSRTGQIFYRTEDQRIMVADYKVRAGVFEPEKPRLWSGMKLADTGLSVNLDLANDGKRFIALLPAEGPQPAEHQSHVMLVVNFLDEVRRRVAGQGK